jgi:membrane protease YdiL (CAAX protease family)
MMSLVENVYAQQGEAPKTLVNPVPGITNLGQMFAMIINIVLGIGWALVFVMLAMGFVQYVMSRGEKQAVEQAQKWLTYAVIGGVGLFLVVVLKSILPQLIGGSTTGPGGGAVVTF